MIANAWNEARGQLTFVQFLVLAGDHGMLEREAIRLGVRATDLGLAASDLPTDLMTRVDRVVTALLFASSAASRCARLSDSVGEHTRLVGEFLERSSSALAAWNDVAEWMLDAAKAYPPASHRVTPLAPVRLERIAESAPRNGRATANRTPFRTPLSITASAERTREAG